MKLFENSFDFCIQSNGLSKTPLSERADLAQVSKKTYSYFGADK